jgi:acyl carrier protein
MISATPATRKSPDLIYHELRGMSEATIDAFLRFWQSLDPNDLFEALPGLIAYHLPRGAKPPPDVLADDLRLAQDLGLDSLALSEMAFKIDEMLGLNIETREVTEVNTVGQLKAFLAEKIATL